MIAEEPPDWFADACSMARDDGEVEVAGCRISYRAWGKAGSPVVVLVHGGAAHAGWWDHVGPHLTDTHRVIALDLSGHGDSARRAEYSIEQWAEEVVAVASAESDDPPILFGHSMGGLVVLAAADRQDVRLRGVAAIDAAGEGTEPGEVSPPQRSSRAHRIHETRELVLERFRTLPEDESSLPFVRGHLAAQSVREVEGGWTWKFDPHMMARPRVALADMRPAQCAAAVVRGERGLTTLAGSSLLARRLGPKVPVTTIPDAGHHIMLDQPVALIATLQTLLGQWQDEV